MHRAGISLFELPARRSVPLRRFSLLECLLCIPLCLIAVLIIVFSIYYTLIKIVFEIIFGRTTSYGKEKKKG